MKFRFNMRWWALALILALLPASFRAAPAKPAELVDLNRAAVAELLRVPGITQVWAARIVRFRPYRTKLDLLNEGVVSPEVYRRIQDAVVAHRIPAKR